MAGLQFTNATRRLLGLAAVWSLGMSGCTALTTNIFRKAPAVPVAAAEQLSTTERNVYTIELRTKEGRSQTIEKPLTEAVHVQEALQAAGAFKKFSTVELELIRSLPNGGQYRMGIEYSSYSRRIDPEFDYALHAGDRLVVQERTETMLDDAMNSALKPLGLDRSMMLRKDSTKSRYKVQD